MTSTTDLVKTITEGIQEKKGRDIVVCDLRKIDGAIAQYFVICQGQFSIENRDDNTPYIKKVRVVTTVTYSLKN